MNEIYFYPKNHVRRSGTGTKTVKTRTRCYFSSTDLGSAPFENCNNLQRILFLLLELFAIFGNKKSMRVSDHHRVGGSKRRLLCCCPKNKLEKFTERGRERE
jgi:hypothetical protein